MKRRAISALLFVLLSTLILSGSVVPCLAAESTPGRTIRVGWYESGGQDLSDSISSGAHGYDYEYLQALSQYTGWTYEYVPGTWAECLNWLQNGEIDLLGFVSKAEAREAIFGYPSLPMANLSVWIAVHEDSTLVTIDADTLEGLCVGIVRENAVNDYFEDYCEQLGCTVDYVVFDGPSEISPALESGEIDAAIVSDEDMTASEKGLVRLSSTDQYYVTNLHDQALLKELDNAMSEVNSFLPGLNNDLYQKYFSQNVYGKPVFTAAEQAFIQAHPDVLVKYDSGWPPIEYYDETIDDYVGISPDLFRLLSEKCGINFVYEGSTSGQILSDLQGDDTANVLTTISYDYTWAEQHNVYITQPFITSSIVRLGKDVEAQNPVVAINENAYFTFALQDELAGLETLHFSKQAERLEAVRTGKADYTFVTEDQANYYRSIPKYSDLNVKKLVGYEQGVCISVTKDSDPALLTILSKALASISHDEMTAIIMKNTVNSYDMTFSDLLYEYRVPTIIISFLLVAVIAALLLMIAMKRKNEKQLQIAYQQEREAHEQERLALAAAEKASAAKGSFMSRISHEIRTPLNAVIGYNTIARSEISSDMATEAERRQADMKVLDCLTKCEIASKHLLTIINDVLDMSAIENGKIQVAHDRFDFKSLISSLTSVFYSQAKNKGVEFEVTFDTLTEEWFVGDQMRVNQILTNLLSNAIKFTSEGSVKLVICQPEAKVNAAHIHFEVIDTGIGMTQEYLDHIWTPFEQADPSISRRFGGTGLGLSITKNLIDLMGGSISVTSAPGAGTTFSVDLTFERTEQPTLSNAYDFSGINALIVDDDPSTCDYVQLLFNRCGARCRAVTSGEDAISAFSTALAQNDKFTVCMVDWRMPKMDGLETVERIREIAGDDLPIIIITAYDFSEIADAAKSTGVNMFVSKPLFQSSLFDLLANVSGIHTTTKMDQSNDYNFSGQQVLLAEDNIMNMEIAKKILESVNLSVNAVYNGREAVEAFNAAPAGTYKAILMDVQMPEMDGYEATRTIRASSHPEAKTIPIVAMTADAFAENVAEAFAAGMNDHVSKPIDMGKLFQTLGKYIPNAY